MNNLTGLFVCKKGVDGVMTRQQLRDKYGVAMCESPELAHKELTDEEAGKYEKFLQMVTSNFEEFHTLPNDDTID